MEFESVAANLRESFRVVAAHRAAGELQEMEGVSIPSAGVTFQMFNAAFLSAPVVPEGQMDLRVAQAAVHFATRGQRWAYWICHGWLDGRTRRRLQSLLRKRNLYQLWNCPACSPKTCCLRYASFPRWNCSGCATGRSRTLSARSARRASTCLWPGFAKSSTATASGTTSPPMRDTWTASPYPRRPPSSAAAQ